jgi:hypothetical protein
VENFGEEEEAQADRAPMDAADEEWAERIEATESSETLKGGAITDAESGEGVPPQRRTQRRSARGGGADQDYESMDAAEEPTGRGLAAEKAAATPRGHATSPALLSAFEPASDDAHTSSEAPPAGDTEAERAWTVSGDDELASKEERPGSVEGTDDIVVVGGSRPPIAEPGPRDTLQPESEEGDTASAYALPSFGESDDAQEAPLAANDAVGEARPPLEGTDEDGVDLEQPLQVAEASVALRTDEPQHAYPGQESGVAQPDDGRPLPVDSSDAEAVFSHPDEPRQVSEETRGTEVVRVEEREDGAGDDGPRRGWWQRLLS